jgi:hypothetical protein
VRCGPSGCKEEVQFQAANYRVPKSSFSRRQKKKKERKKKLKVKELTIPVFLPVNFHFLAVDFLVFHCLRK